MISIFDQTTFQTALEELSRIDPDLGRIIREYGPPPMWQREQGFATLLRIILEQQVSLASARAVFEKLSQALTPFSPQNFLKFSDDELKSCGFSRQKTAYGRYLAQAIVEGSLDLAELSELADETVKARLMKIKGIGHWTADIYLLMALGRPDIWPAGDLALIKAVHQLKGFSAKPPADKLARISQIWKPWRAVAARLLWHFYLSERG